jgi:hypothetical protein
VDDPAALGERLFCSVGPAPRHVRRGHDFGNTAHNAFCRPDEKRPSLKRSLSLSRRTKMNAFLRRFLMHYEVYRRYPLGRLPALRNAWRTARP